MPVISLLTDFGIDDEYVGLVKAVIYGIAPEARIVDLCHRIDPHDISGAALLLAHAWPYFPDGSVHLIVVDPGVGSARDILAVRAGGHTFVAPDNGVLTRVLKTAPPARIVRVQNRTFFRDEVSQTFHGRDVFAPVGAHLLRGLKLEALGPVLDHAVPFRLDALSRPQPKKGALTGTVVWIDRFGNLITDLEHSALDALLFPEERGAFRIEVGGLQLTGLASSYADVESGRPLAVIGSRGTVEIAVNQGNAAHLLGCRRGDRVRVWVQKSG